MIREYVKQTIVICSLLQRIALSNRTQEQQVWQQYYDKCRKEANIISTLPSELEKTLHWSPTINKGQREIICYILWNMVYVEGGTANLGDSNSYPVDIASFFINRYEASQDEWYVIMGENPSNQRRRDYPVDQVSWFNAQRSTKEISQSSGLPFRLPFEAEWEYAARGGLKTKNFIYAGSNDVEQVVWFRERYHNTYVSKETGMKKPNGLGLYDMSGSVYGWCIDWYDRKVPFTGNITPIVSEKDMRKVLRGGSYYIFEKYCKVTSRYGVDPQRWDINYELRLIVSLPN